MVDIKKNIEEIRKEHGIKQSVLAEMLGISQSAYSQIFTRNNDIKYGIILEIANKLGVSVIDIITYPDKYVPQQEQCSGCKEKNEIIKNLNEYIELLRLKNRQKNV